MSNEMHPIVAEALRTVEQIQSMGDADAAHLKNESFRGADETETVKVTLDGRQWLTGLYIADGLLRLGVETVALRVNEAIQNAQATATAAVAAQQQEFIESLGRLADSLTETIGTGEAKPQ
ncbi:YbaB/EbfC family nucleoid-associated protein [Mycobacterium sp. Aquia_213]|uniref:YbaB/EbfC family nucleoid-associated protein n=1 Tax=Mycobacterium sp. Aquia_213 TaxID=2991728 RepID=UPI002D1E44FB|nr:YbaB/EbfC family nucleoid-associated protein [Mycobacterium sp. Aquia_213]